MIEAGENVLLETLGGAVECHWEPRDLAVKVFQAMVRLDAQQRRPKVQYIAAR